jgi:hypothetical protein
MHRVFNISETGLRRTIVRLYQKTNLKIMITYTTTIHQFEEQGEKTGWTYIEIPADIAQEIFPGNKKSFRVKGKLDSYAVKSVAVMPMGNGNFIMALNAAMRKGIGKRKGAMLKVALAKDDSPLEIAPELLECLADEPDALAYFQSLAPSHQRYFSNWVNEAKTETTKAKRLAICLSALARKMEYGPMIREQKGKKIT